MAINSKDIETLWQRYSAEGVGKGISVAQYFESNGVPYHTFEKWYVNVLFPASGNQYKCLPLWQKTKVTKLCQ